MTSIATVIATITVTWAIIGNFVFDCLWLFIIVHYHWHCHFPWRLKSTHPYHRTTRVFLTLILAHKSYWFIERKCDRTTCLINNLYQKAWFYTMYHLYIPVPPYIYPYHHINSCVSDNRWIGYIKTKGSSFSCKAF